MTLSFLPAEPANAQTLEESPIIAVHKSRRADQRAGGFLQARTRHVEACVSQVFNVRHESLRASTRGKANVARARQVAMYICHTTLGFSLTSVGELFERDRTTVGHACRLVEDLRDDPSFDAMIICIERACIAGCIPLSMRKAVMGEIAGAEAVAHV